jgi:apolipoprotein N-acyltransferase
VNRTSLGTQQIVFADLSRRSGWTVYVRYGDWPPLVLAGVALLAGWFIAGRRPSASGSDSDTDSDTDRS